MRLTAGFFPLSRRCRSFHLVSIFHKGKKSITSDALFADLLLFLPSLRDTSPFQKGRHKAGFRYIFSRKKCNEDSAENFNGETTACARSAAPLNRGFPSLFAPFGAKFPSFPAHAPHFVMAKSASQVTPFLRIYSYSLRHFVTPPLFKRGGRKRGRDTSPSAANSDTRGKNGTKKVKKY